MIKWAWYQWRRNNWIFYPPRFVRRYSNVNINRPIFLVGNQGDGLTLVSRILRRHPDAVSISGGYSYWAGADEMQKVMACRLPPSLRLGGARFCKDKISHPRLTPPYSWAYASDDLINYFRKTERDYDDQSARTLRRLIAEVLYRYGHGKPGKRFIDKSQVFTVKMSYVDALLRDTNPYFVLITRNPYATIYRAAMGKAGDMRRYAKHMSLDERVEICTQHWANSMQAIMEDKNKICHFKQLRFEDLLSYPHKSVHQLCDFLELDFLEDLVPAAHHKIPFGSRYTSRWYPLHPDVNEPYLNKIPKKYVDLIAARCGNLVSIFGYECPPGVGG